MKTPNTKHQTPTKLHCSNTKGAMLVMCPGLVFGIWNLFGVWCLVFGVSSGGAL
jgi:hypothetical protein